MKQMPDAVSGNPLEDEVKYTNDHILKPNGVGDFALHCPTLGKVGPFIPIMLRKTLKGKCQCGQRIELDE